MTHFLSYFSSEKYLSDRLFYMAFYVCLGLLPPLIGVINMKVAIIPFIIISTLVIIRFFIRPHCQEVMLLCFKSPPFLWILAFIALLLFYIMTETNSSPGNLFLKPLIFVQIAMTLCFSLSHQNLIDKKLFLKLVTVGFWAGLLITTLKIVIATTMGAYTVHDISLFTQFLLIDNSINGMLVILSLFCSFTMWNMKDRTKSHLFLAALYSAILLLSFFAVGSRVRNNQIIIVEVISETVLFAIPFALLFLALSYKYPKKMTNIFFAGFFFLLLNAPWLYQILYLLVQKIAWFPSARKLLVRMEIWDAVAQKIVTSPFIGHGLNSIQRSGQVSMANDYMPSNNLMHSHNMVLQLWLDLGIFGIFIMVGLLYIGWRAVRKMDVFIVPSIVSALVVCAIIILVTHSLWHSWILAIITNFIITIIIYSNYSKTQRINIDIAKPLGTPVTHS